MTKPYQVSMEIAGPTAIWTRPDTGDCPTSYPAPTYSAVKGIFSSVFWGPATEVVPFKVEICAPLHYHSYNTNYGGPLRKSTQIEDNNSFQLLATVLTDVCYKLYAHIYPTRAKDKLPPSAIAWDRRTTSPGHAYKAIFERRLKKGDWWALPALGWREFTPSYVGPLRAETKPCDISTVLPSMLRDVFGGGGYKSAQKFIYDQNVEIKKGVLIYPEREATHA